MSNASNHLSKEALDHLTGNGAGWTRPTNLYLALLKVPPVAGDDTTADATKELETSITNGYTRPEVTLAAVPVGTQQCISLTLLTIGPSTTGWGQAVGAWITDSATPGAGNIWLQGTLVEAKTAGASDSILFAIGEVIFTLA